MRHGSITPIVPSMRGSHRLTVVVETDDEGLGISEFRAFDDNGMDVVVCAGPGNAGCPVLEGRHCGLVDLADVVMHRLDDPGLVTALRHVHRDVPVVVISDHGPTELPDGAMLLSTRCSVGGQVVAAQSAALIHRGAQRRAAMAMASGASPPEALQLERDLIESWSRHPSARATG